MSRVFDSHFHLLFKHFVTRKPNGTEFGISENVKTTGIGALLNDLFGGPFDSQASPTLVSQSQLYLGMTSILSVEHAFANRVLHFRDMDLSKVLPLDHAGFTKIREGKVSYNEEFLRQLKFHLDHQLTLSQAPYHIHFLKRADYAGKTAAQISTMLNDSKRYFALTIEGGHNLSPVNIRSGVPSQYPERQLMALQDDPAHDFLSLNLCHLSEIPEQRLGSFAQGHNKTAQLAFHSDDFMPKSGLGLTELGKKVIKQALTHDTKPIVIDVKHMSLYTRLQYYKYRDKLVRENPKVDRIPVISSHSGFTFITVDEFIKERHFKSTKDETNDVIVGAQITPRNRKIGKTDDLVNSGLHCNPWTINFFDEEIIEIMKTGGVIGISLDQRILGSAGIALNSIRDKYFEPEYIPLQEWQKLFINGEMPGAEAIEALEGIGPTREERHIMLLCMHIIHAVRVGYKGLAWAGTDSPWKHLCIGSDFDGMINPINGIDTVLDLKKLSGELKRYLPVADKQLTTYPDIKALQYSETGKLDESFLDEVIQDFLYQNGERFIIRWLRNWQA